MASGSQRCSESKCPEQRRSNLPKSVSNWERSHIENVLHIYYAKSSPGLSKVLDRIPTKKELGNQQKKYIDILKSTNFGPNIEHKRRVYNFSETKTLLEEAIQQLEASNPMANSSLSATKRALLYVRIRDFITVLGEFVTTRYQKAKTYAERELNRHNTTPFICEETYSKIVSAFAVMCGLRVEKCTTDNVSVWENLRGSKKAVISKPDFRFHCTGEDFSDIYSNSLTVTEVKIKDQYTEEETFKRKRQNPSEQRSKRRRNTSSFSSSSSSIESDEYACPSEKFSSQIEKDIKPWIEIDVGKQTLGRHAGDLLLDLHSYLECHPDVDKPANLTMPGMIVDKAMVYLTLLEISYEHYKKLAGTEQLTSEDIATIYYSPPYNILDPEDRCFMINTFVSLNNIDSISK